MSCSRDITASSAEVCFLLPNCSQLRISVYLARYVNLEAIIFSAILPRQFSREITLYDFGIEAFLLGFFRIAPIASFQQIG